MNIKNKIVIVTGASSGIGLATAKLLTEKGAKVALAARSKEILEKLSQELKGSFSISTDITDRKSIEHMVNEAKKHYGRIDILINNAGQGYDAFIEKTNIDTFHHIFDLDIVGPLIAMQQVIPLMRDQDGGMIVNISSATALMYLPNMGAYSALKRALAYISLTAREELEKDNIIVSVVYPYITLTNFEKNTIKDFIDVGPEEGGGAPFPPDTAEYVAQKILQGIETEEAEIFVHEWIKKGAG